MTEDNTKKLIKLTRRLFNQVEEKDVLRERSGKLYRNNQELTMEQVQLLVEEAITIKSSLLWNILMNDLKWEANKRLYFDALDTDSMTFPRAMLFCLDVLEKKLDKLANKKL